MVGLRSLAAVVAVATGLFGCSAGVGDVAPVPTAPVPTAPATTAPATTAPASTALPQEPPATGLPPVTVPAATDPIPPTTAAPRVTTGAARLAADGFRRFAGQRVAVVVNHGSVVGGERLVDLLDRADGVTLTRIFTPEHGLTGRADAGELLDDGLDPATGVPIHSLYGDDFRPRPEHLDDVDVILFDLQDVGARFYTYISTLGLVMQSAAEAGLPVVILDRPNPLGGERIGGFLLEPAQLSFVGQYPIPAVYGWTAGELATAIRGEGWMPGLDGLVLSVEELHGWDRAQHWPATGLPWIAPSPGLPTFDAALVYPGTVLIEATSASYGTGTAEPFTTVGGPWVDGEALAAELGSRELPGVRFETVDFVPRVNQLSSRPRWEGEQVHGVRIVVTERARFAPVATGIHLLDALHRQAVAAGVDDFLDRPSVLDLLSGTTRLREMIEAGRPAAEIVDSYAEELAAFEELHRSYLRY